MATDSSPDRPTNLEAAAFTSLQAILDDDQDGLLDTPEKPKKVTSSDRLERSFLEIVEFVQTNEREPDPNTRDIAERKLGARLEGIRANPDKIEALQPLDKLGLLEQEEMPASLDDILADGDLDLLTDVTGVLDTASLPETRRKHKEADSIARRKVCKDFDRFEPMFKQKQAELAAGDVRLLPFSGRHTIKEGSFFVLNGMMLFVAEFGEESFKATTGKIEHRQRLRVIFENGTESGMYLKSLSLRLYDQGEGYVVAPSTFEELDLDDEATGWIYILRSQSQDPQIQGMKDLYKIGFSTVPVEQRVANASQEPTYLMAPVEIVETYRTYNMKTSALEHLIHRFFADVRMNIEQVGNNGKTHNVTEWFQAPLPAIRQAIELITSGDIVDYVFDVESKTIREL